MRIRNFLKDKWIFILFQALLITFLSLILYVLRLNFYAVIFVIVLQTACAVVILAAEYLTKQGFYKQMERSLDSLDKKYLLSEILDRPSFFEGEIFYDATKTAFKSMNDNIAVYKLSSDEYREYIETWVHEIKTPIAAAKLIIDNNRNEITKSLEDELFKIDNFVEQALFYSRSNTLQKDFIIKEVMLSDLVKSAVKKYSMMLIENKISIELKNLDIDVFVDTKWVEFVLGQIISNSIKYKKSNSKLEFFAKSGKNGVILSISDNGIGIPSKDLNRVFDKGFTGDNGRMYAKSTGIGLYLCKKLCDKMGLSISVLSEQGIGTTINIAFPNGKVQFLES